MVSLWRQARRGFREAAADTFEMRYWTRTAIMLAFHEAGFGSVRFRARVFCCRIPNGRILTCFRERERRLAFRRTILEKLLPVPEELVIQADAHFSACAIFLAPVAYVAEPLAVYRIHGGNLWNLAGQPATEDRLRRRIKTTRMIGDDVRQWLDKTGFDVNRPDLHAFLMQWTRKSREDEFALSPPGRWRFFRHLLEQPRYFGTRMTWRHKTVFYANALASLVVGYRNYPRLDEWRIAAKRLLGFPTRE